MCNKLLSLTGYQVVSSQEIKSQTSLERLLTLNLMIWRSFKVIFWKFEIDLNVSYHNESDLRSKIEFVLTWRPCGQERLFEVVVSQFFFESIEFTFQGFSSSKIKFRLFQGSEKFQSPVPWLRTHIGYYRTVTRSRLQHERRLGDPIFSTWKNHTIFSTSIFRLIV